MIVVVNVVLDKKEIEEAIKAYITKKLPNQPTEKFTFTLKVDPANSEIMSVEIKYGS